MSDMFVAHKINDFIRRCSSSSSLHLFAIAIVYKESTCWRLNDLSPREKLRLTYDRSEENIFSLCVCVCVLEEQYVNESWS